MCDDTASATKALLDDGVVSVAAEGGPRGAGRLLCLAIGCALGGAFVLAPPVRVLAPDPASAVLAGVENGVGCGSSRSASGLPVVEVLGGPSAPPLHPNWLARVCTRRYPGPHCSNSTPWHGEVTLCVDGAAISGAKLHTRGHISLYFPKQQYGLKLPEARGLLGMAPARRWVLAMSFVDTTFQRSPIAFEIYRRLGGWATQVRYVNLRWHGRDMGLHYVGERIEIHPGRLELPSTGPAYLLSVDWSKAGVPGVSTAVTQTPVLIRHPSPEHVLASDTAFVQELLDEVDRRAASGERLSELVDLHSFARYYVLEELAKDIDGYAFSNYMSIFNGKLHSAAPWDFDLAFDFVSDALYFTNYKTGEDTACAAAGWNIENSRNASKWVGLDGRPGSGLLDFGGNRRALFLNIWRHAEFQAAFRLVWLAARRGHIPDETLLQMVSQRADVIREDAKRDLFLWRNTDRCGFWTCCHRKDADDFEAATQHLAEYLVARARWIDLQLGDTPAL